YRTEAQIYAKHMLANVKDPRLAILYQNDDFGKDYPLGVRDILGSEWDRIVVKSASYETTDPTIDSQIVEAQNSSANVLLVAAIPKFAAQSIRKVYDSNWKPTFYMTNVAISVGGVLTPAGPEKAIGMLSTAYLKDPTEAAFNDAAGLKEWRDVMAKYLPHGDATGLSQVFAYVVSKTMRQVLKQCAGDYPRANVMHQAESLHGVDLPVLLPGIKLNATHTDHRPITSMQFMKWDGKTW